LENYRGVTWRVEDSRLISWKEGGCSLRPFTAQSTLTPWVDLASVWIHQGAINEAGGMAALDVKRNTAT
jgi:hypothetical protein